MIDYASKFEFYDRLAHAAERHQGRIGDDALTASDLLLAMVDEAYAIIDRPN